MLFPNVAPRWRALLATALLAAAVLSVGHMLLNHAQRVREEKLLEALALLRDSLQHYREDVGHYPQQLDALVNARYLRQLPKDPLTDSQDTWLLVRAEHNGIVNVFSSAAGRSGDGTLYQRW